MYTLRAVLLWRLLREEGICGNYAGINFLLNLVRYSADNVNMTSSKRDYILTHMSHNVSGNMSTAKKKHV